MATEVDICNLALSRLGDRATVSSIDPPEGSAQADHCARFYPMARDAVLSTFPWRFATVRTTLARLTSTPVGEADAHYFQMPSDCLRLINVGDTSIDKTNCKRGIFKPQLAYTIEQVGTSNALKCRASDVWIEYVSAKTPAANFPSDFADCLAWLLASYLAGTIIPGSSGIQVSANLMQFYQRTLQLAQQNDADQRREFTVVRDPYAGDATIGDFNGIH